jgi:nuclear pore complex protein Nup155
MNDYWSDDFAPLEAAGNAVLAALRKDEAAPDADLYRRIVSSGSGSHLYFPMEQQFPGATMTHRKTVPLPPTLAQELQTTRVSSLMGLLPEAELVWMTVDETLYLWSSNSTAVPGGMEDFCSFTVPTGQCIVSVGLVKPKKGEAMSLFANVVIFGDRFANNSPLLTTGVFKDVVEWCLVVSTPEEVILCALARAIPQSMNNSGENGFVHGQGSLRLIPTRFVLPTDSIPILSVCGTPDGRIFLGGYDGCLYEMTYDSVGDSQPKVSNEERLNAFYNGDKPFPSSQSNGDSMACSLTKFGKRALSSIVPSSSDPSKLPRKCRKLNHSAHASSVVSAILPSFLVKAASVVSFSGDTTAAGPIVNIIVDSERSCMYTLSSRGWISAFDLCPNPKSSEIRQTATIDVEKTARLYLEAVSRGRMYPPSSSHSSTIGNITFPGGGSSAQAGVGGMDGARTLLKLADSGPRRADEARRRSPQGRSVGILTPISIHVISRKESGRLTLMAITNGGLRYYLSSLSTNVLNSGPGQQTGPINPLAPSRKFTLCHVRAPPPIDENGSLHGATSFDENGGIEGYVPSIRGRSGKVPHVDAGYYGNGTLVLALEQNASQGGSTTTNGGPRPATWLFAGDAIVATEPDAVARKKLSLNPTANETTGHPQQAQRTVMTVPGGITETVALPLASTSTDVGSVLPGGRVHDIASMGSSSSVMTLFFHSQTPSDAELKVGLVPAYIPPSRLKAFDPHQPNRPPSTSPLDTANTSTGSRSIVVANGRGNGSVALTILSNFLLSRPLRHGLLIERPLPALEASDPSAMSTRPLYRLSTRYGYAGFSTTAADTMTRNRSSTRPVTTSGSKSARLSPWLLRPAVAALDSFTVQHLLPDVPIVALNSGGMHFFTNKSILSILADTLISAGVNVGNDESVSRFFASYGFSQGCSMCLCLAVGCGPAADSGHYSSDLRTRARRAALSRAHVPKLVKKQEQQNGGTVPAALASTENNDGVPPGYEFHPSSLSQGLTVLASRLLRPVWYKPAVVVTEGQSLRGKSLPAKVELLLDDQTLEEIRQPLYSLRMLMKDVFGPAINVVPGAQRQEADRMEVEDENTFTSAMLYHGYIRGQAEQAARNTLTPREAETMARLIEERNLHSLYRLVSRSVQLLSLLALLKRAQYLPELHGVEWGLLHGLTVAQLVQTRDCQERLEHLLSSLVGAGSLSPALNVSPSAESEELAQLLSSECYLYFSPASHYAYMGFRAANEALSCAPGSSRRIALSNQTSEYLKRASCYWYNAPLITGRILHGQGNESFEQIALRAMRFDSPLAKAADALFQLSDVVSIVDVCLTTASNFGGRSLKQELAAITGNLSDSNPDMLPWERMLYHKRTDAHYGTRQPNTSSSSPSSTHVLGAAVTSKDALSTCYAILFHYLSLLLNSPSADLARKMIDACAKSPDPEFLHSLYDYLIRTKHFIALLQISSADLEKWLSRPEMDIDLIWQYYREQGKDVQAGEVMRKRACEQSSTLDIATRINFLRKALSSYTVAIQKSTDGGQAYAGWNRPLLSDTEREGLQSAYTEVSETLDVAVLQNRTLRMVQSTSLESKLGDEQLSRLKSTLVPVSDLYNEYAAPLSLSDICLLILHSCRHDDVETIRTLWQNVICEEIFPCATRSPEAYRYLQSLMSGSVVDQTIRLVPEGSTSNLSFFEDGDWVVPLSDRVISLGQEVYGNGADYVFPVEFLASKFEGKFRGC